MTKDQPIQKLIFITDEILLKEFNLCELYDILNNEEGSKNTKYQELIETFNKYYYYNSES